MSHHVLHEDRDLVVDAEHSVEADDVGGVTVMEDLQLSHDVVADCRLDLKHYHLRREGGGGGGREEGGRRGGGGREEGGRGEGGGGRREEGGGRRRRDGKLAVPQLRYLQMPCIHTVNCYRRGEVSKRVMHATTSQPLVCLKQQGDRAGHGALSRSPYTGSEGGERGEWYHLWPKTMDYSKAFWPNF